MGIAKAKDVYAVNREGKMVQRLWLYIMVLGIIGICSWTAHGEAASNAKYDSVEGAYLNAMASTSVNYFIAVDVTTHGNSVTVDLQDAEISDVLREIERGSNVRIEVDHALTGKKITAKFENKDVEGALREIARGYKYVLNYSQDSAHMNNSILNDVSVGGDIIGTKPLRGNLIKIEIPYGSGKGEVSVLAGAEGSSDGPCSYAVDDKDTIYILDRLNNRVQVYSSTGSYLSTISLRSNIANNDKGFPFVRDDKSSQSISHDPIDIVADSFGFIYVYDSENKIYQYDMKGNIISSIIVDKNGWSDRSGPMKIVNNELFMGIDLCDKKGFCGNAIVGRTGADKKLGMPTLEEARKPWAARKYQSGKTIKGRKFVEGYNTDLDIVGSNDILDKTLSVPYEGVLTVEILGEDKHGNFYFKTRTAKNEDRLYNIDAFSPNGDYLGTAQIPGGTYYVYPAIKDFIVSRNGNIYYYVPEKDSLKIFIFLNQSN